MMKVLHVISNLERGGAEAVLFSVATHGTVSGVEHRVVCLQGDGYYSPKLAEHGVAVDVLNCRKGRLTIRAALKLWSLIRAYRPDVVQTWMYHADLIGGVIGRLAGVRPVCWAIHHANLDYDKNSRLTIIVARLCALLSRHVPDRIVSCSQRGTDAHAAFGYEASKFTWIPNGYDTGRFSIDRDKGREKRRQWRIPEGVPLIGCVARWNPQKDHRNLFRAVALMGDCGTGFRLVLVGQNMTPENSELLAALDSTGLRDRVVLAGPDDDIPSVMNALDIHVLPSAGEAFPNVVAEAMACGALCVSTDVGDVMTIVDDCGWVVPACTPAALADALRFALNISGLREGKERRQKGRERIASQFSISRMQDSYEAMWQQALADRHRAVSAKRGERPL
jgi:glycosyltransferase involved in cell wall biosynthesis